MGFNGNDVNLKVGFDIDRFQKELQKTNGILNTWGANVTKTLAGVSVGFAAMQIGKQVIQSLAEFEAEMSNVKAVTGATQKEFDQLKNSALNLASAYGVTSKGVAQLETQYARLGFSTTEILDSTKAAIQLSRATGEDLATSAQIAGSTLRAFNLDASEMNRIADVMAMSFNNTALGLSDFGEAIKYVAPVAANANISLEQTTAMLGVLADAGIKGSQAGTSLRKIISDLGQGAGPILTKKLKEMAAAGLSGAAAMDEVGRTAYASLLVLANNTRGIDKQTKALKESEGQLDKVAKVVKDNLIGDWEKFTGTLDAFVQKGSAVNNVLREIVKSATLHLQILQNLDKLFKSNEHGAGSSFAYTNEDKAADAAKRYNEVMAAKKQAIQNLNSVLAENANKLKQQAELEEKAALAAQQAMIAKRLENARNSESSLPSSSTISGNYKFMPNKADVKAFESMAKLQEHMAEVTDKATESMKNQSNSFDVSARNIERLGAAFGESFGMMASGAMTFQQSMKQMANNVVHELYRVAQMQLIARSAALGPVGLLAASAGLAALHGLVSGLLTSTGGTSYSAGSQAGSYTRAADRSNINITGKFTAQASDLVMVLNKANYKFSKIG